MVRHLGEASGVRGALIAFTVGSAAAGPLYAAFPVAQVLLKKGASMRHVLVDIVGIAAIAWLMDRLLGERDRDEIRTKAGAA